MEKSDVCIFRGNPHHLAILNTAVSKGDIAIWNTYVRRNGTAFKPRLAGADLSNLNLNEIRLVRADLDSVNLSGSSLIRSDLTDAKICNANLDGCQLNKARMNCTNLSDTHLKGADLSNVNARGAILHNVDLTEALLDEVDFSEALISGSTRMGMLQENGEEHSKEGESTSGTTTYMPKAWRIAQDEEAQRRKQRKTREAEEEQANHKKRIRKLGQRKPFFQRIK